MLKGIPKILSPILIKTLCEMGHSDRIVLADGNFPAESIGSANKVVRCDGHGTPELLKAILDVFPLDIYVEQPVKLMDIVPGDTIKTPIWDIYKQTLKQADERGDGIIGYLERFRFYEEARTAYAIVATGESALYANIILQKGVIT